MWVPSCTDPSCAEKKTMAVLIPDAMHQGIFIVTVPTPIDLAKRPDLGALGAATKTVASVLSPGSVVIYESTVYPGCTRDFCVPILEQISGLKFNEDFFESLMLSSKNAFQRRNWSLPSLN